MTDEQIAVLEDNRTKFGILLIQAIRDHVPTIAGPSNSESTRPCRSDNSTARRFSKPCGVIMKRKVLARADAMKIGRYLAANWNLFKQERFTMDGLAAHIQTNLSIDVSPEVLRSVIQEADLNFEEIRAVKTMPPKSRQVDRFRLVCSQMAFIGEQVQKLSELAGVPFDDRIDLALLKRAAAGQLSANEDVPRQQGKPEHSGGATLFPKDEE